MRVPRVFVDLPLTTGETIPLPEGPARHLSQVLRLGPGDLLSVFNGDGTDREARVASSRRQGILLEIGQAGEAETESVLPIGLALGVSRGERMDYAIQKAVELGVARIQPLFTERSMVQLAGERLQRRMAHWTGVLIGACEQSGRRRLPSLMPALDYPEWLAAAPPGILLLDPESSQPLVGLARPEGPLTLLVGPEGGLSPKERALARAHGIAGVRLGPRILRAETAPLAAIAAIQALWGDFGD